VLADLAQQQRQREPATEPDIDDAMAWSQLQRRDRSHDRACVGTVEHQGGQRGERASRATELIEHERWEHASMVAGCRVALTPLSKVTVRG
jgi:hypothetical protein